VSEFGPTFRNGSAAAKNLVEVIGYFQFSGEQNGQFAAVVPQSLDSGTNVGDSCIVTPVKIVT
jgi:hypothetical protein